MDLFWCRCWRFLWEINKLQVLQVLFEVLTQFVGIVFFEVFKLRWNSCTDAVITGLLRLFRLFRRQGWWRKIRVAFHFFLFLFDFQLPILQLVTIYLPLMFKHRQVIVIEVLVEDVHVQENSLLSSELGSTHRPRLWLSLRYLAVITSWVRLLAQLHCDWLINVDVTACEIWIPAHEIGFNVPQLLDLFWTVVFQFSCKVYHLRLIRP